MDVFIDEVFEFVAVFEIREFAYYAVDSVEVEVFGEFVEENCDFGVDLLLFLLLFCRVGGTCLFHELLVLLLDDYSLSLFEAEISVGSDDHTFSNILLQFRIAEKLRNGGINHSIDVEYLIKGALCIDWN